MRYLDEHPEVADEIEQKIREYFKQKNDYTDTVELGTAAQAPAIDDVPLDLDDIDESDLITEIPDDL